MCFSFVVPLYFVQHPVDVTVRRGSAATFYCFADGSPKPSLSWLLKGQVHLKPEQSLGRIQVLEDGTLEIANVRIQDDGLYSCVARNNMSQRLTSSASLKVMYPPVIINMSRNTTVSKDTELTLQCVVKGYPSPTVTWVTRGEIGAKHYETMTEGGKYTLNIARVRDHHEGKFTCEAKNKLGKAKKELFLNVEGKL